MSTLRADIIRNREGSGAPSFPNGAVVTGVITATSFSGALTGNVTGNSDTATLATNAQGLTGSPNITVTNVSTQDVQVGGALTVTGNLTVNGTTTTIDTATLSIEDSNLGIASVTSPSNTTADGAGITIFGGTDGDKTWTWERDTGCFEYSEPSKFKGVIETVAAATTYNSGNNLVLELDVRNATTYTYTIPTGANIGVVSFKNMPAFTGNANGTTITCIFTQNAAGTGNTTGTTGIGTNCTVIGYENGSAVAGISTRALVGSGTTVSLSSSASDRDFVSFFVHYTGGTNTTATSYQVYATKNGGFRQGNVGV
jgi:hypothetical protein